MKDVYVELDQDILYWKCSDLTAENPTILFIHGLGESSLCFQEAFEDPRFAQFNLLAPDLAGYGRSSESSVYNFDAHLERLFGTIELFRADGIQLDRVIVVGHSMGADLATLFCASKLGQACAAACVNIEGDLTDHDLFISSKAVEADEQGRFNEWFERDFKLKTVYEDMCSKYESCRRYYASLCFARPDAFLENAMEIYDCATSLDPPVKSEFGQAYLDLTIPKVFCFGETSLSSPARDFLKEHSLESISFADAFHWPMIDCSTEFYKWLFEYASTVL